MAPTPENQLKLLTARREKLFCRIQQAYDLSKEMKNDPSKTEHFQVRCTKLEETFTQFETVQEDIFSTTLQIDPETKVDLNKQTTRSFEELYYKVKLAYDKLTNSQKPVVKDSPDIRPVKPRLPEIDLPKFDGSYNGWTPFYDNFRTLIHGHKSLNDIEKFHYLLSSLSWPALSIARSLPISETNYAVVWEALVDKYENKRVLGTALLDTLFNCSPQQNETASTLNYFLRSFYEPVMALKALNIPDLADFLLMYVALRNLPVVTRKQFEVQHMDSEIPTFENLVKFLQNHARILEISQDNHLINRPTTKNPILKESVSSTKRTFSNRQHFTTNRVLVSATSTATKLCPCCKQQHTIFICPEFQRLSPSHRTDVVKANRLCFNCLRGNHSFSMCQSKTNCLTCNRRHHTLLHHESKPVMTNDSSNLTANILSSQPTQVLESPNSSQVSSTLVQEAEHCSAVLLGTAIIHVKDCNGMFQPVRAFIGSAAQTSFMTSACANRLGLTRKI